MFEETQKCSNTSSWSDPTIEATPQTGRFASSQMPDEPDNRKLRIKSWSVRSLGWKKGSRLRLCFRVVNDVPEKKGMDLWKEMSSSKCSFTCICGTFLPLNPSTTTNYARYAFYPSPRFTLSLQSAFYTQFAFYPRSAVCSLQSAVFLLHWPVSQHTTHREKWKLVWEMKLPKIYPLSNHQKLNHLRKWLLPTKRHIAL